MRAEADTYRANSQVEIDPRSVPRTQINWPAAFRLKPARIPGTVPLASFGQSDAEQLVALKNLTSPTARHKAQKVLLQLNIPVGASQSVLAAFANSIPEWRFAPRGTPHMVIASSVGAALSVATEIYGQFMRDTAQKTSTLSFSVERFRVAGNFANVCDREIFPACYDGPEHLVPQRLTTAIGNSGEDGLVFGAGDGQAAVILNPAAITSAGLERALALEWNGDKFHRAYDYRDMYWRDMEA